MVDVVFLWAYFATGPFLCFERSAPFRGKIATPVCALVRNDKKGECAHWESNDERENVRTGKAMTKKGSVRTGKAMTKERVCALRKQ